MRSGLVYQGKFVNQETDATNANIQKECTINIYDTEFENNSTFNTQYFLIDNGDGTETVWFNWGTLPDAAVEAFVGYSTDGVSWTDTSAGGVTGPISITIPTGTYQFSLFIDYDVGSDPRYIIPDPTIEELEMADSPVSIEVIDNSEDNFTPIRSKQLTAQVFSSNSISISTFAYGGDKRYCVEYYVGFNLKFAGWLSISDLSMEFMPDPNIITLTAADGLGFLNDIPLTDFDGENPRLQNQIMDYIAWALSKTGHELNIVCCFNIRERYAISIDQEGHAPLGPTATVFQNSPTVAIRVNPTNWFYVGQTFTTDDGVNPGPFTVSSVVQGSGFTDVFVIESFTLGLNPAVTFTDTATTYGNGHLFKHEWLEAKTFEADIGSCIDCYEALLRIFKEEATLFQDNGTWFIMRKDEYSFDKVYYLFTFDWQGNFISATQPQFEKSIGVGLPLSWMDDSTDVSLERPYKSVTENFEFEQPQEVPDNSDLSRGTVLTPTTLTPESWIIEKNYPPISNYVGYTQLVFVDDLETERFLRIPTASSSSYLYFRNENKLPLQAGDKFTFSCDWRYSNNPGGSGHYRIPQVQMRLYGDDGTNWTLNAVSGSGSSDPMEYWIQSNSTWATNNRFLYQEGALNQDDLSLWQSASWKSAPAPVSGRLEIFLMHQFESDQRGKDFAAISFEYIPYIQGTYQKYLGQQHRVEQAIDVVAAREEQVYMTDSIKQLWKGVLLKIDGQRELFTGSLSFVAPNIISFGGGSGYYNYLFAPGLRIIITGTNAGVYKIDTIDWSIIGNQTTITLKEQTITTVTESATLSEYIFVLANQFYSAAVYPDGDQPDDANHPYGHLQVFDVWNQYQRVMSKFDGTIDGLDSEGDMPDLKFKYYLTDVDLTTTDKMFQLLHFEQDQHLCQWNAFFHEVQDRNQAGVYTGNTFKYITKNK